MKADRHTLTVPPAIAAAARRRARAGRGGEGGKKDSHNYIAEKQLSLGPAKGNRKGAGAPPGNDNALRANRNDPELRRVLARGRDFQKRAKALTRAIKTFLHDGIHPDTRLDELRAIAHARLP